MSLWHRLPPEHAHRLALAGLALGLGPRLRAGAPPELSQRILGLDFAHPVGLAAGFDKDARVPHRMQAAGLAFCEVGTVTPRPQAGNPAPRVFRLPADRAVINRLGFNNAGLVPACDRLARLRRRGAVTAPVGVNLGVNKDSADPAADYRTGIAAAAPVADYLAINVSSPNTPGLRDLQGGTSLPGLLADLRACRDDQPVRPPLLVKIAPDLDAAGLDVVAEACLTAGIDGVICTNTTTARPGDLVSPARAEPGGLSGAPLCAPATAVLAGMFRRVGHRLPLIGVGGVSDGATAYAKIRAGATLVQLYTALTYEGLGLVRRMRDDLATRLAADGLRHIGEAVGADSAPDAATAAAAR